MQRKFFQNVWNICLDLYTCWFSEPDDANLKFCICFLSRILIPNTSRWTWVKPKQDILLFLSWNAVTSVVFTLLVDLTGFTCHGNFIPFLPFFLELNKLWFLSNSDINNVKGQVILFMKVGHNVLKIAGIIY